MTTKRMKQRSKRGDLFFLTHPGTDSVFSGYGLAVHRESNRHLVGLLMVDRPHQVSIAWLRRVEERFGEYELYPMTTKLERGMACQMWVDEGSLVHVSRLEKSLVAYELQAALLPLLVSPPKPKFKVSWDETLGLWRSEFDATVVKEETTAPSSQRRLPLFPLGHVVATPGALAALEEAGQLPQEFLHRHNVGDWGDLDKQDWQANERALREGQRLFSAYSTKNGTRLWIISEWDRSVTTMLTPSEY